MPYDDHGFLKFSGTCPCGAGVGNNYQHHEFCLANLPVHTDEMIIEWKRGRHDARVKNHPRQVHKTEDLRTAYKTGWNFESDKISSEITRQSLEQARQLRDHRVVHKAPN
jgi:hypothetical protein